MCAERRKMAAAAASAAAYGEKPFQDLTGGECERENTSGTVRLFCKTSDTRDPGHHSSDRNLFFPGADTGSDGGFD
jgi:hypothetical protein